MAEFERITIDPDDLLTDAIVVEQVTERVRPANYGLAAPLMGMLRGQGEFETYRAADTDADEHELAVRLAGLRRVATLNKSFTEETSRAKVFPPVLDIEKEAGIYGRIADDGEPVPGVTVMALDDSGESPGFTCTDDDGGFTLVMPAPTTVRLRVVSKDGAELHRDRNAVELITGARRFREIDLARVPDPCPPPEPPPPDPQEPQTVEVPSLVLRTESEARKLLKAVGLNVGERTTVFDDGAQGRVVDQNPAPGQQVDPGTAVDLVVAIKSKIPVPDVVGVVGEVADELIKEAGLRAVRDQSVRVGSDQDGLVIRQDPPAGAELDEGGQVRLTLGRALPAVLTAVAADAEAVLREREVGVDRPDGWLLSRLEVAGVHRTEELDAFLNRDREELRATFEVRTMKMVNLVQTQLRRALKARLDG